MLIYSSNIDRLCLIIIADASFVDQCDRVKPCHACCAHGYPSKCVYEPIPGDDPISQTDEIRNLRLEIHDLRCRIDNQGNYHY